jgi:hypothetical protein
MRLDTTGLKARKKNANEKCKILGEKTDFTDFFQIFELFSVFSGQILK